MVGEHAGLYTGTLPLGPPQTSGFKLHVVIKYVGEPKIGLDKKSMEIYQL